MTRPVDDMRRPGLRSAGWQPGFRPRRMGGLHRSWLWTVLWTTCRAGDNPSPCWGKGQRVARMLHGLTAAALASRGASMVVALGSLMVDDGLRARVTRFAVIVRYAAWSAVAHASITAERDSSSCAWRRWPVASSRRTSAP